MCNRFHGGQPQARPHTRLHVESERATPICLGDLACSPPRTLTGRVVQHVVGNECTHVCDPREGTTSATWHAVPLTNGVVQRVIGGKVVGVGCAGDNNQRQVLCVRASNSVDDGEACACTSTQLLITGIQSVQGQARRGITSMAMVQMMEKPVHMSRQARGQMGWFTVQGPGERQQAGDDDKRQTQQMFQRMALVT